MFHLLYPEMLFPYYNFMARVTVL